MVECTLLAGYVGIELLGQEHRTAEERGENEKPANRKHHVSVAWTVDVSRTLIGKVESQESEEVEDPANHAFDDVLLMEAWVEPARLAENSGTGIGQVENTSTNYEIVDTE